MPRIKRYPNRKLYDTEAKKYVTLEGIAALIRDGQEVEVVDYATGEDLTAVTLTQVILEQEKKRGGFLPEAVLAGLIQAGGETLSSLRRSLASPLELARHVDEEIERRVEDLTRRGELAVEEARQLRDQLLAGGGYPWPRTQPTDREIQQALADHDVATQADLEAVAARLEALAAELEQLGQAPSDR